MNLVFKEYCQFLKDKTGLELEEGYYWYDKSIIKAFDKQGNVHKIYRLKVNDDLSMTCTIPKGYDDIRSFELASWEDIVSINKDRIDELERGSLELIEKKFKKFSDYTPLVPISTGKDSMVVLYLTRKIIFNAHAVFNNTSLDCADTYKMVKTLPDCEIMSPDKGFYQYVQTDNMIPTRFSRFCCRIFKTGVMVQKLAHDVKYLLFMGMRNEESATRAGYEDEWVNAAEWGDTEWQGILPIRQWTDLDIWLYTLYRKLPVNSKYKKGYQRCGCHIACPYYSKSTWVLDDYWYPKMRKRWLDILEKDFIENAKWPIMNCTSEEYKQVAWNGGMYRDAPTEKVIDEMQKHMGISDKVIVEKYFNNCCSGCGKKVKKDEVGLSLKFYGRKTKELFCFRCLGNELNISRKELKEMAAKYKSDGCSLF
ncbi:phosphoadenosine phosphosulfate reductase family protein [Lachnospiraceae bacterium 54-53]